MTKDTLDIERIIHDHLTTDPAFGVGGGTLDYHRSLIAGGVIDSLAVLGIVEFLEERFAVRLDPEDLTGANFDSIAAMAALVRRRLPVSA